MKRYDNQTYQIVHEGPPEIEDFKNYKTYSDIKREYAFYGVTHEFREDLHIDVRAVTSPVVKELLT